MSREAAKTLFVIFILMLPATTVMADQYHYTNMLIGDRASGMGGAYVAISDDPSGLFYNPAGIVYAPSGNLSASMNAFHYTRTEYKSVLDGKDWVRNSSALLPNFFGVIQPLGIGMLGFSYAVIDAALEDQDQIIPGVPTPDASFSINFNNQDNTYLAGPSYAIKLNKKISIGITAYAYTRSQELIFNQIFTNISYDPDGAGPDPETTGDHWENSYSHISEYGIKPMLGIMMSPVSHLSLGLTFAQTFVLSSAREVHQACSTTYDVTDLPDLCTAGETNTFKGISSLSRQMPWEVRSGFAFFWTPRLIISGDAMVYRPMYAGLTPLVNVAGGLEYYMTPRIALRMGGYTNFANTPPLKQNKANQPERIHMLGGSMSLTHFTRSSAISVGLNGGYGRGQAQVIGGLANIQQAVNYQLTGFMSASYSY